ncbi:GyrI-like domain-containing protein [Nocardioides sp.]|uniref:GyrI-like domain-containing protein n=1 Tax=Nocardioides sp. TaxID=35761 RepID=UPI00261B6CD4|nr:GyrI-like domain-containing protein [Nocardioides sp.]MDI6909876.1 GyrI-like domain-containing protein [Nocardioides sp.]
MNHTIEDVHEAGRRIAVTSFPWDHEDIGELMAASFGTVSRYLARIGVPIAGPAVGYYTKQADGRFRVSAGFVVDEAFEGDGTVELTRLPAGRVISTVHIGPYERLTESYDTLQDYAARHHLVLDQESMWEEYLSGPEVDPEQVHTRVTWPVTHANVPVGAH